MAIFRGPGEVEAAVSDADLANGARVYMEANGDVGSGAATEKSMGVVTDSDPAATGPVVFDFDPWGTFAHA